MKKLYKNPWQWCRGLKNVGITVLTIFGAVQGLNAQVSDYTFTQSNGIFSSIASTGSLVTGTDATTTTTNDTTGWSVTIPFNFNFNGTDYTSIYVNSNGGATFGTTTSNSSSVISATSTYAGAVGAMNRDLWGVFVTSGVTTSGSNIITNVASFKGMEVGKVLGNTTTNGIPTGTTVTAFDETAGTITMSTPATLSSSSALVRYGTGKIFTSTIGTAPNRVFVIEWIGYNDYGATADISNYLNFQLRLAETTNTVSVVYGPYYNIYTTARTNQIGLRGTTNSDFNNRSGAAGIAWTSTSAGTANSATVSRDNTNFPASGQTFTWVPPTCLTPSALTVASASITATGATASWTAPSTVPANGYEVYYSTSSTVPTSSTVLNTTNSATSTTTSAPLSGLLSATTYYVWVRSACVGADRSNWTAVTSFTTLATCFVPSAVTIASASITSTGATVSWTAPSSVPSSGYEVYYSTSNTAPTSSTVLNATNSTTSTTNSAPLSGLLPSTIYYVWVRSACVGTDRSVWTGVTSFMTLCQPPAILSTTDATVCPGNTATISATADSGAIIKWYSASTGGTALSTGNSFTTPVLSTTTPYYVSASTGSTEVVGVLSPAALSNGGTTTAGTTFYMEATVTNSPVTVQSVDVFPSAAGNQSYIRVYSGTSTTALYEIPFTSNVASGGTTPQTISLNIILNPGVYRFKIEGAGSYYRNYSSPGGVGQAFPYGQGNFKLTGGSNVTTGYYLFYNFIVGSNCESARQMVTATVSSAGCLGTSETSAKEEVSVYPNPFTDVLNISDINNVKSVSIVDISGKLVKTFDKPSSTLYLGELNSGMYLVVLNMKGGSKQTIKAIKK